MTGARRASSTGAAIPSTINHAAQTDFAARVARKVAGDATVDATRPRPWAPRISPSCSRRGRAPSSSSAMATAPALHHPAYDFNDEAIVYGTSYWIRLVENSLAA